MIPFQFIPFAYKRNCFLFPENEVYTLKAFAFRVPLIQSFLTFVINADLTLSFLP